MIKNRRVRLTSDQRGKIKSGKLGRNKADTFDIPVSLDHFNVEDFPEIQDSYGKEPKELVVFCPTDNIEDFFFDKFGCYGGSKENPVLKRSCDGETCIHRINENLAGQQFVAGEEGNCICDALPEKIEKDGKMKANPELCRYVCDVKLYVAIPPTYKVINPACYIFETGSENSGGNILSELEKISKLNMGRLYGVPFRISVRMLSGKEDAKQKFPIWDFAMVGMLTDLKPDRMLTQGFVPDPNRVELPQSTNTEVPLFDVLESELNELGRTLDAVRFQTFIDKYTAQIQKMEKEDPDKYRIIKKSCADIQKKIKALPPQGELIP